MLTLRFTKTDGRLHRLSKNRFLGGRARAKYQPESADPARSQ